MSQSRVSNATPFTTWTRRLVVSLTILVWLVLGILIWWLLGHVIGTLISFAIAILLAYALYPVVKFLQRFIPRPLAILAVYLFILSGFSILLYMLAVTTVDQVVSLTEYIQLLLHANGNNPFAPVLEALNRFGISQEQVRDATQQLLSQLQGLARNIGPFLAKIFDIFLNVLLVAVLSVYLLVDGPRAVGWLRANAPLSQRGSVNFLLDTAKHVGGGYIRGQLLLSTILSTITGIAMAVIGVPYAVFLGVLAFVLSFIPTIGAFITGATCVVLALTQGWLTAVLALGFLLFLQVLETQILGPRIVGPAVGLHPIVALLALLAGGELFGLTGALFAAIVAGILQALLRGTWSTWRAEHPEEFRPKDDTLRVEVTTEDKVTYQESVANEKSEA